MSIQAKAHPALTPFNPEGFVKLKPSRRDKVEKTLERHLQEKYINHFWLTQVLEGDKSSMREVFPYQIKKQGTARITRKENVVPAQQPESMPVGIFGKPSFLVNIPMGVGPFTPVRTKVTSLVKKLTEGSFSDCATSSQIEAQKKLAVVIGINQMKSLDKRVNALFEWKICSLTFARGEAHRVEGFFWEPEWEENRSWQTFKDTKKALKKEPILEERCYTKETAYLIVKCFDSRRAMQLKDQLEGISLLNEDAQTQIPFCAIRERIKNSVSTFAFAKAMKTRTGPVYFMTMDADAVQLRPNTKGCLSLYTNVIEKTFKKEGFFPSVLTLGYHLGEAALPIPRLAVRCDMKVREAMNQVIPGSVYMPEPCTAYYLSANGKLVSNLKKISFHVAKKKGFESRRLIENGIAQGSLQKEHIVFKAIPSLETTMPTRMGEASTCQRETLSAQAIKLKSTLKALRGVSQVHFNPLSWGHNLYEGLPSKVKKGQVAGIYGKLSGVLSHVFTAFDPIAFALGEKMTFDRAFKIYEKAVSELLNPKTKISRKKLLIQVSDELKPYKAFLQGHFALLTEAKTELKELELDDVWISQIVEAAKASGKALFDELKVAATTQPKT